MDLKSLFFVAALSFPCILLASPVPGTIEWPPLHVVSRSFNEHSILSPSFNKKRGDGTANDDVANGTKQKALAAEALENALASLPRDGPCTKDNIEIRPEWRDMPNEERKAYSDAVQCLQASPSILDPAKYTGAKTRYDDFIALHIEQAFTIHNTANFLVWHRYFVWVYHQTLKIVCGYTGRHPYWEWGLDVASPRDSPIFNGDEYSMGSDGAAIPHGPLPITLPSITNDSTTIDLPAGTGGGCVFSGPFTKYTVNLGPLLIPNEPAVNSSFAYNPRCLKRDLSPVTAANWTSFANYTPIQTKAADATEFQTLLDGDPRNPFNVATFGPHGGGHFTIAGDPGSDFQVSPGDPAFFLHHGQVDRVYWIWQNLKDQQQRMSTIPNLTRTLLNQPPSPLGELSDPISFGPLSDTITNKQGLNTLGGTPYCYVYE